MEKLAKALVVAAVALGVTGVASPATPRLTGTVGPGFTIALKQGQKPVKALKAGRYTFAISDRSSIHDFAIRGPGVNKALTAVGFTGTKTVTLTLKRGTYTFYCQPHASSMRGTFRVS
jgi:plastocyanin